MIWKVTDYFDGDSGWTYNIDLDNLDAPRLTPTGESPRECVRSMNKTIFGNVGTDGLALLLTHRRPLINHGCPRSLNEVPCMGVNGGQEGANKE